MRSSTPTVPDRREVPLVLWAGCVRSHDLLSRADALHAGGFASMSVLSGELERLERESRGSVALIARELEAREARAAVIDPFIGWYPGWEPDDGPFADLLNVSEESVLRYAQILGAESMTLLTPFTGGPPAPVDAVIDALGALADRAAAHGVRLHLEVVPTSMVPDLATGWQIIRAVDRANAGLVLDTFHLARSGAQPADLNEIPLEKIFHIQLCDASLEPWTPDYFEEAVSHRQFAGEGELPIKELTERFGRDGAFPPIGPEVFSEALDALSPAEVGRLCGERTRSFLATLEPPVTAPVPSRGGARS